MTKKVIGICNGPTCCKYNQKLWECAQALESEDIFFEEAMCLGMCETAPSIRIDQKGERTKLSSVTPERLKSL